MKLDEIQWLLNRMGMYFDVRVDKDVIVRVYGNDPEPNCPGKTLAELHYTYRGDFLVMAKYVE